MKLTKSAQELIDRYLLGIRRTLTGKKREDITAEIESLLYDRMEERFIAEVEITEGQVKEVLQEMGSPRKLASSYGPQRYLIGPRLYPAYLLVLRIVVPVVIGALTLSIIISALTGSGKTSGAFILEYLASLWNGAFMAAAFVTLTFAILERVNDEKEIKELDEFEKFNADDLPELSENEKQPTIPGIVFEMVMGIIGLAFFTYILNNDGQLPIFFDQSISMVQLRIFSGNFMRFVPVMMAFTGLEITRSAIMLAQGRQSSLTTWWHIVMEGAHIVLNVILLRSFPLIALDGFRSMQFASNWDLARIGSGINSGLKVIMILSLVGSGVEIIRRLYREICIPSEIS